MKNRAAPKSKTLIPRSRVLPTGKNTRRWSDNSAAEIEGIVFDVESTELKQPIATRDLADRDTHLEIVRSMEDSGSTRRMVVEITPRLRAILLARGLDWS